MNVSFRVDAGSRVGDGHAMRCLTLADALAERGARTSFIFGSDVAAGLSETIGKNHRLFAMPSRGETGAAPWSESEDAEWTMRVLSENRLSPDWLVVDHYELAREWENRLRSASEKLLVIDDLANRPHTCDLLLDPTYAQTQIRYENLLPAHCRCLCGSEYALLRPQFRRMRQQFSRELPRPEEMCVHVFFGSADAGNNTVRFSRILLDSFASLRVRVAVGHAYLHRSQLQRLAEQFGARFSWDAGIYDMAAHMAVCDVALGAPGGTTWERACIGLPSAYLAVSANQPEILEQLQDSGLCAYFGRADEIGDAAFVDAMRDFLRNVPRLRSMRLTGMHAIDGGGAIRVADVLEQTR